MFKNTLAKHFSSLTDVRMVRDPWGIGFSVPVLREGHESWKRWLEANRGRSTIIDMVTKAGVKAMLTRTLSSAANDDSQDGFRRRKKLTRRQREADAKTRAAEVNVAEIIERSVDALPASELAGTLERDLNAMKPGVAAVLLSSAEGHRWQGVLDDVTGQPVEFTLEKRLEFLGWRGFQVTTPDGKHHFLSAAEYEELDPSGDLGKAVSGGTARVQEFSGNQRDERGNLLWVDDDQLYGPGPVGDCLTEWVLTESADGEEYKARFVEEAVNVLTDTPGGDSATSAT